MAGRLGLHPLSKEENLGSLGQRSDTNEAEPPLVEWGLYFSVSAHSPSDTHAHAFLSGRKEPKFA